MKHLQKEHFIQAADYIDNHPIPKRRHLRDWAVSINGRPYPPKYTLSVALMLSGDNNEVCNGQSFITNDALTILKEFNFSVIKLKKAR